MNRLAFLAAAPLLLAGCTAEVWGPEALGHGKDSEAELLARGRETYITYCVGCHGVAGDGNGTAARHLDPKPRDLRLGRLKFALVASGKAPRDEDYLRIIERGLAGTAMPAFPLMSFNERRALVAYVKTFHGAWDKTPPGAALAIPADPYRKKPDKAVTDGERLYHGLASCHSCHAAYATKPDIAAHMQEAGLAVAFRSDMYAAVAKDSDWGAKILPPDFLVDRIKTGYAKEDIVRVVAAGVGGTAMPTWASTLTPKQLWSLAYYVEHLAWIRDTPEGRALRDKLDKQPDYQPPAPPTPPEPAASADPASSAAAASASAGPEAAPAGSTTTEDKP